MSKPRILECTLRDGSYVINFQFSAADTAVIAGALEESDLIEVAHGIGLGALEKGMGCGRRNRRNVPDGSERSGQARKMGNVLHPRHRDAGSCRLGGRSRHEIHSNRPSWTITSP